MRFSDFVTLQRGFDLPKTEMQDGPYPVLGSTSIIGFHSDFKVEPPGVVTGRSGSLGVVQFVAERYWPHNTSLWVKDFKGNDAKFVYYCMKGLDFARFNAGAGVPTLNRNHLDSLEVEVPPPSHPAPHREHPLGLRRADREQPAAHQDSGVDGSRALPGVVRPLPLPWLRVRPSCSVSAGGDS